VKRPFAILAFALIACREPVKPAPQTAAAPEPPMDVLEQGNLMNMALGASVVSRTAELTLDNSAIRAIDGDPLSTWTSPPSDNLQTIVFSAAAPMRIEQIGMRTPIGKIYAV
jgi:hypothetical protein